MKDLLGSLAWGTNLSSALIVAATFLSCGYYNWIIGCGFLVR